MTESERQTLLNELSVLLSEKRTYYSILRTGLVVVTVPLTVIIFLFATYAEHGLFENPFLGYFVVSGLLIFSFGGLLTSYQARQKARKIDGLIAEIEDKDKRIDEIIL